MKILIADDEPAFRRILEEMLVNWGYEVIAAQDGEEAWHILNSEDAPPLAILDWMMPGMDGVELCQKVRQELPEPYTYIILLTSQQRSGDLVIGMEAGADDYITKPLQAYELRVRLNAGRRVMELQSSLAIKAAELKAANKDLETFSYTFANDLLESLNAIRDHASAIRDFSCAKNNERCRSYSTLIYDKTKQLGKLVESMHDFSPLKIRGGQGSSVKITGLGE